VTYKPIMRRKDQQFKALSARGPKYTTNPGTGQSRKNQDHGLIGRKAG